MYYYNVCVTMCICVCICVWTFESMCVYVCNGVYVWVCVCTRPCMCPHKRVCWLFMEHLCRSGETLLYQFSPSDFTNILRIKFRCQGWHSKCFYLLASCTHSVLKWFSRYQGLWHSVSKWKSTSSVVFMIWIGSIPLNGSCIGLLGP